MGKFEKAVDFYLRGFNSEYIKRRTDISMQSLLKQLLAKGIKYTKDDIVDYQINYISGRYTDAEIKEAYRVVSQKHDDIYKASRGRHVVMLGCGFGQHARVLKVLLGDKSYNDLRNECWKIKQEKTMQVKYGVSNVFEKEVFDDFVTPEAIAEGRIKRTDTMLERYGVEHPNQHPDISAKMMAQVKETNIERYGTPNPMQNPKIARKSARLRQEVMLDKYGAKNSVEIKSIRNKIFAARRMNGTLNTSNPEYVLGVMLKEHFGEDDVFSNIVVDDRYPYHVDFYIKSLDLFIELNGDRCHNDHWFDSSNLDDLNVVKLWEDNMYRIERETGKNSRYRQFIHTWTKTDVDKRMSAKKHNLNYLVFWDGTCRQQDYKKVPKLTDAHAWFDSGCPKPNEWRKENTF